MKSTWLFEQLTRSDDPALWTAESISRLPKTELVYVARIMGAPKSLPRDSLIHRIVLYRQIRCKISAYDCDDIGVAELMTSYLGKELKAMCKSARLYRSGNKRTHATVLLQWRERGRAEGYKEWLEIEASLRDDEQPLLFAL